MATPSISSVPLRNLRRAKSDMSLIPAFGDSGYPSPHTGTPDQDIQNDDMRPSSLNSDVQDNKLSPRSLVMSDKLIYRDIGGKPRSSGGRTSAKNDRNEFFSVFSLLIKLGNEHRSETKVYNRQISEDSTYPNYRDNLWLELQAWHNGRTISEQHEYLSSEREKVSPIIDKLLNFKYERIDLPLSDFSGPMPQCDGCLSIYCQSCLMHQSRAMKIVCDILDEIEKIELLYPSSKAVGLNYPTYRSERFIGRLKSLCVWLNTIRTLRMRIDIVGSIFHNTSSKVLWPQWPVWNLSLEEEESDERISTIKLMRSFSEPGNYTKSDGNDQPAHLHDTKEDIQVVGSGKIYRRSNSKVRFFLEEKLSDGEKNDQVMDDILSNLMEVQSERSTNTPTTTLEPAPWTPVSLR
ncbi:mitogen-activated protein kinase kinase kinase 4-like [Artemia franciscana]|uniref:mitogen-activated protein kinase kinase kinase 4-like n=1 Tax=Artemia franciscana TaxID=6661 RepID=UPI0032D9D190